MLKICDYELDLMLLLPKANFYLFYFFGCLQLAGSLGQDGIGSRVECTKSLDRQKFELPKILAQTVSLLPHLI